VVVEFVLMTEEYAHNGDAVHCGAASQRPEIKGACSILPAATVQLRLRVAASAHIQSAAGFMGWIRIAVAGKTGECFMP